MKRLRNLALSMILLLTPGCCLMWDVTNGSHSIAPGLPRGTTSSHNLSDSRQGGRTVPCGPPHTWSPARITGLSRTGDTLTPVEVLD